jgi:hypothetical protein
MAVKWFKLAFIKFKGMSPDLKFIYKTFDYTSMQKEWFLSP